jgi:4'-phosphopantetheinyl transferase
LDKNNDHGGLGQGADRAISEDKIDLWLAFYQEVVDEQHKDDLRALLNDEERRQEKRFVFADDRRCYLVTRATIRTLLSRYVATVAPTDWMFSTNEYGRPQIANLNKEAAGLCFNISHTRGLIAVGISQHRTLGVDVENLMVRKMSDGIANRFFAPSEVAALDALEPERRAERFFEYWTFKESYIKARSMGLSIPLDRFSFHYPDEQTVRIEIDSALDDKASRWCFLQYRPTSEHLLAICAERPKGDGVLPSLRVRRIMPLVMEESLELTLLKRSSGDS